MPRSIRAGHHTRSLRCKHPPDGFARKPGRLTSADLPALLHPPPRVYVCGPTAFVEAVSDLLVLMGYDAMNIRTERFGPSGT